MKNLLIALTCLLGLWAPQAAAQYRTFTDTTGRKIGARIAAYNPKTEKITIQRMEGKKVTVPVSIFSEHDQAYINDWIKAQQFLSNSKLQVVIKKNKARYDASSQNNGGLTKKATGASYYSIKLNNRSDQTIDNLKLSYQVYVKKENRSGGAGQVLVTKGQSKKISILPGQHYAFKTKSITLHTYLKMISERYENRYGVSSYDTSKNKICVEKCDGIRIRLFMQTSSGNEFSRDICYPKSTEKKHFWRF